ncbi:hypothetical protein EAI_15507 [Harpegnathos saltator]|uniref:Uncharacterized protein n=1 Tax=Harpegnathos saltator TaxID=610380 RepID=E2BIP7_HARSA|nr:hypothetical protein EAI_15507 [Harpegnathos saltator]
MILYSKIISQKGYAGQVTCRCDQDEKKNSTAVKEKSIGGCCSKRAREAAGGCCMSGCCKLRGKDELKQECCENGKQAKNNAEGCCAENRK